MPATQPHFTNGHRGQERQLLSQEAAAVDCLTLFCFATMPGLQQGQLANSKAKRGVLPGMHLCWTVGEAQGKMEAVVAVVGRDSSIVGSDNVTI